MPGQVNHRRLLVFLGFLGVIALAGLAAGVTLATLGYSSAGPFSVAAACVGVIGTLAAEERARSE